MNLDNDEMNSGIDDVDNAFQSSWNMDSINDIPTNMQDSDSRVMGSSSSLSLPGSSRGTSTTSMTSGSATTPMFSASMSSLVSSSLSSLPPNFEGEKSNVDNAASPSTGGVSTTHTTKSNTTTPPAKKKTRRKKPKDMPKRPLSAYNLFFADERQRLLTRGGGRIVDSVTGGTTLTGSSSDSELLAGTSAKSSAKRLGFAGLARVVAAKWKTIDPDVKARYEALAATEQVRYKKQIEQYNAQRSSREKMVGGLGGGSLGDDVGGTASGAGSSISNVTRDITIGTVQGRSDMMSDWSNNDQSPNRMTTMSNALHQSAESHPMYTPEPTRSDTHVRTGRHSSIIGYQSTAGQLGRTTSLSDPELTLSTTTSSQGNLGSLQSYIGQSGSANQMFNVMGNDSFRMASTTNNGMISWNATASAAGMPMLEVTGSTERSFGTPNSGPASKKRTIAGSESHQQQRASPPLRQQQHHSSIDRRLSDPQGIEKLASELDDDQLNVMSIFKDV